MEIIENKNKEFAISFLKAFNGDCIHINYYHEGSPLNLIIDGGISKTYSYRNPKRKSEIVYGELYHLIKSIQDSEQNVDLLILTHVDEDHIAGILKWIKSDSIFKKTVKEVWFNSGSIIKKEFEKNINSDYDNELRLELDYDNTDTSIRQGVKFEQFIRDNNIWKEKLIQSLDKIPFSGLEFTILSPNEDKLNRLLGKWKKEKPNSLDTSDTNDYNTSIKDHIKQDTAFKEDASIHNGSSIAFILRYGSNKMLFLGDSHPTIIVDALKSLNYSTSNKLDVDFTKLSHHGSQSNTNKELLDLLECNNFIISSNGDKHNLPHKRCLSRVINQREKCQLFFNYPELINDIFSKEDKQDFPQFKTFPSDQLTENII